MASAAAAIAAKTALSVVPRRIRVLIVDTHQLVQEGLAAMISREEDMTVVAAASRADEALHDVRRYRPDVAILDLLLPDMPGEDLGRQILAEFPDTRIVAITSAQSHVEARRALDAGIHGYLSKAVSVREMVRTIRQVRAGERIVPGPAACPPASESESLTAREVQVLQLAAWGTSNREVAAQLSIAPEAVRMHMRHLLEKLGARDRAHAVTIALTRGILQLMDWGAGHSSQPA
jgi:DNA-binding NarL/FixJ family response regulator